MSEATFWTDLEQGVAEDGVDAVFDAMTSSGTDGYTVLARQARRVLDLEAHHLRDGDATTPPGFLAQQMLTRAIALGATELTWSARRRIDACRYLVLCERWRTQPFSPPLLRTLAGHTAAISEIAFPSNGRVYALGADSTLRSWEVATGLPVAIDSRTAFHPGIYSESGRPFVKHAMAVSPDGSLVAVAFNDRAVRIYDPTGTDVLVTLAGHLNWISHLLFPADGSGRLFSASEDRTIRIWDVGTGVALHTLTAHQGRVTGLTVSGDGDTAVSSSTDGTLRVWDTRTGRCRQSVDHGDAQGWGIRVGFAARDRFLVVGSDQGALYRYDVQDGRLHNRITLEDSAPGRFGPGVAWSITPIGPNRVLVTNDDAVVDVWDVRWAARVSLTGHGSHVKAGAVSADERLAVTGDDDGRLLVWSTDATPRTDPAFGFYFNVEQVAVSAAAGLVACAPQQSLRISARDLRTGEHRWTVDEQEVGGPRALWFSAAGTVLYAERNGSLEHRSARSGELERTVPVRGSFLWGRGRHVLTAEATYGSAGSYRIAWLDVHGYADGRQTHLQGYPGRAAATPDTRVAVFGNDGTVTAWDSTTGEVTTAQLARQPAVRQLPEGDARVRAVAVDDEGCHALACDLAGRAHLWDIRGGDVTIVPVDREYAEAAVGLARHRAVTVGMQDGVAVVWDLVEARPVCRAPLDSRLSAVAADGRHVVVGDGGGNTHALILRQGDPTPPAPPADPVAETAAGRRRPSLLRRLFRIGDGS